MKIAVVGTGIAGNVVAHLLAGDHDLTVFEQKDYVGGHTNTVRVDAMNEFFRACSEHLAPDGMALIQAITVPDQRYELHRMSVDFIKEYIFPGSCVPSVTSLIASATRVTDFRLSNLEDVTPHYARTLRAWRERFLAKVDDVRRLGYDGPFIRMWEYYLAYCEGSFEERNRSSQPRQPFATSTHATQLVGAASGEQ
jgi:cyclopropane fatty-acyl-phospholipid synthase-like methyltransferase